MSFKIITETENYAIIKYEDGNKPQPDMVAAMSSMMDFCEVLLKKGYRPLHYVPKQCGWFCEKPKGRVKIAA